MQDLNLYYGNMGLITPSYPYARPLHIQENVAVSSLGLEMNNIEPKERFTSGSPI